MLKFLTFFFNLTREGTILSQLIFGWSDLLVSINCSHLRKVITCFLHRVLSCDICRVLYVNLSLFASNCMYKLYIFANEN